MPAVVYYMPDHEQYCQYNSSPLSQCIESDINLTAIQPNHYLSPVQQKLSMHYSEYQRYMRPCCKLIKFYGNLQLFCTHTHTHSSLSQKEYFYNANRQTARMRLLLTYTLFIHCNTIFNICLAWTEWGMTSDSWWSRSTLQQTESCHQMIRGVQWRWNGR